MRTGPVLATDLVDKYQPLGAFGQPVYLSYVQLRAAVAQKLGQRHAHYFARPDRDPQNKSIHWIAEVPGTARRWVDLTPEDQALQALELQAMRSDFLRYLDELRRQPPSGTGTGGAAFASLLEQALLVPDDSHLYFVGDQPVVTFWGFKGFDSDGFDAMGAAPRRRPGPPPPLDPEPAATGAASAAATGAAATAVEEKRKPWWRWLLRALLALLLLLLLLFLLRTCLPDEEQVILFGEPPAKEKPLAPGERPLVPGEPPPEPKHEEEGFIDRTLRSLGLSETVPGGDAVVPGQGTVPGDKVAPGDPVPPPGVEKPLDDKGVLPEAEKAVEPPLPPEAEKPLPVEPPLPPEAEKPVEPPLPPKPDGVKPEDLAPGQKPETPLGPDGKPLDPKATPGTPPATPPGTPPGAQPGVPQGTLQIPPDAPNSGTAGFLGGTWKSETGLVEKSTGKPLQQSYRFDQQGKGEVTVRRPDGAECRAPAQARMQGGRLSIEETGDPRCPDGSTYNRSKTECSRTPSGQTVCVGRNPDGSTYRVGIQRQP